MLSNKQVYRYLCTEGRYSRNSWLFGKMVTLFGRLLKKLTKKIWMSFGWIWLMPMDRYPTKWYICLFKCTMFLRKYPVCKALTSMDSARDSPLKILQQTGLDLRLELQWDVQSHQYFSSYQCGCFLKRLRANQILLNFVKAVKRPSWMTRQFYHPKNLQHGSK